MSKMLHISASPRGERSESLAIARTFLEVVADLHPDVEVEEWDLWDGSLPGFGPDAVSAKYAVFAGADHTPEQATAWTEVRETFSRLNDVDYLVFSVPMWNHGIPYVLKQLIDVVSQPGLLYGFDPVTGYLGLLTGKRAVVIYTSGVFGDGRGPAFGVDFQEPYFDEWLRWAGVEDRTVISFRPNLAIENPEPGRQAAHDAARDAAKCLRTELSDSFAGACRS
jgi:FMN-dependent NADH-azoreductase